MRRGDGGQTIFLCLAAFAIYLPACVALQIISGAYQGDVSATGDQAGHFVSGLMVYDYITGALGSNPMRFATEYYAHFPKVMIGHWPPFYYGIETLCFLIAGPSKICINILAALLTTLLCSMVAVTLTRYANLIVAFAAGAMILVNPELVRLTNSFMADSLVAILGLAAALCWASYVESGRLRAALAFALFAIACILTKGSGFFLALLPPLHAALTRNTAPLIRWRTWIAAAIVAALTLPWYIATYRIAADGFVYHWGWDYTSIAIPSFLMFSGIMFGPVCSLCCLAAGGWAIGRNLTDRFDERLFALLALLIAVFVFAVLAPVDLQQRYMLPALAPAVILTCIALGRLLHNLAPTPRTALICLALASGIGAHPPRLVTIDRHMDAIAATILADPSANPLVLIGSDPPGEGAIIAAMALRDRARVHYAVRGSKVLSSSDFMGRGYQLRFKDPTGVADWMAQRHIGWLVIDRSPDSIEFAHNQQILALVDAHDPKLHRVPVIGGANAVELYRVVTPDPTPAELKAAVAELAPAKVIGSY